ncbi:MAG: MerR family transcriptional regulator, partial [Clostridia bacterium]|nr:MerR family transcriptional regulator [Clostridia bacterium]
YESRGLVTPETEEKNGRIYREYSEENIRTLTTIAVLRRADFTLEQIAEMQTEPGRIPEIFSAYREQILRDSEHLRILCAASERIETEEGIVLDEFAARFAKAMEETAAPEEMPAAEESDEWDERIPFLQSVWQMIPPKMRKGIVIGTAVLAVLLLVLHILCRTTPVSFTKEGVLYNRGTGEVTPISVTFSGELKRFLWREDYFTGEFSIEEFYTGDMIRGGLHGKALELFYARLRIPYERFFSRIEVERTVPEYRMKNGNQLEHTMLFIRGLEGDENFTFLCPVMTPKESSLGGTGHSWSSHDGLYIVIPAKTQDDAEFLVRRMWDLYNEEYPSDMPVDE